MTVSNQDESIRQFLVQIVESLVEDGSAVQVDCFHHSGVTILHLRVAPNDLCKVIGNQGRTARSLRTVLSASGMKLNRRYALNTEESTLGTCNNFTPESDYDEGAFSQ